MALTRVAQGGPRETINDDVGGVSSTGRLAHGEDPRPACSLCRLVLAWMGGWVLGWLVGVGWCWLVGVEVVSWLVGRLGVVAWLSSWLVGGGGSSGGGGELIG